MSTDDLDMLVTIAKKLDPPTNVRNLYMWINRRESTGFPEPKRIVGKHQFYSVAEVTEWYELWHKVQAVKPGRGGQLNGKR